MFCVLCAGQTAAQELEEPAGIYIDAPAVAEQAAEVKLALVNVRTGIHPEFDRIAFDWDRKVEYSIANKDGSVSITFSHKAEPSFAKNFQQNISRVSGLHSQVANEGLVVSFAMDKNAKISVFRNKNTIVADIKGKAGEVKRTEEAKIKPAAEAAQEMPKVEKAEVLEVLKEEKIISESAWKTAPEKIAVIDRKKFASAAVFQRAGKGFIIFESQGDLPKSMSTTIAFESLETTSGAGFYFALPLGAKILAESDEKAMNIFIADERYQTNNSNTEIIPEPEFALGGRYVLHLSQKAEPIIIKDITIGDRLIVVPTNETVAFGTEQKMADFRILPSVQGLVVSPIRDNLIVRDIADGIEITTPYGLRMSPAADMFSTKDRLPSTPPVEVVTQKNTLDVNLWRTSDGFSQTQQRLLGNATAADNADKNTARLELARFYFAYGLGAESLAVLRLMEESDADLANDSDFIAFKAAALILADRNDAGLLLIEQHDLANQPEILLWKAIALAQKGDIETAYPMFVQRYKILAAYPDPLLSKFLILAIESAIAADNLDFANELIDTAQKRLTDNQGRYTRSFINSIIEPALNFFKGTIAAKKGNAADAKKFWELAKNSNNQLYKIRSELGLIELAVLTESMTAAQAADRLESLRFAWRGDNLELEILERLGQFYLESGNLKLAMNSFDRARKLFPEAPAAEDIKNKMKALFREAFLGGTSRTLTPLEGLAIYKQYKDLLPEGSEGTEILLSLSEKLITVDLLWQASELLTELVKTKLTGEEREKYILKLAGIHLLNSKPDQAISALDMLGNIDEAKSNEADLLRAKALFEKKQYFEAKTLLENNYNTPARLLLVDIANKEADWQTAGNILVSLLESLPNNEPLSSENKTWILSAAVALALAHDETGLYGLSQKYKDVMAKEPGKGVFALLTSASGGSYEDIAGAGQQLLQVNLFQNILNNYRNTSK